MTIDRRRVLCLVAAGTLPLTGCGGDGGAGDGVTRTATATATATPSPAEGGGSPTATETTTPSTGGNEGSPDGSGSTTRSADAVVEVDGAFDPLQIAIEAGTTVEWENEDMVAHTVTSTQFHDEAASWSFDAEIPGLETITRTFDSAGIYEYHCDIHGEDQMCGAVLVGDVDLDQSLPCEGDDGSGF